MIEVNLTAYDKADNRVWHVQFFSATAAEIEARQIKIAHPDWRVVLN